MKALKNLIISIFLFSVFCLVSYGQTVSCICEARYVGETDFKECPVYDIPLGTVVQWSLYINTFNEMTNNYTYAFTYIHNPINEVLSYKNTGHYYEYIDSRSGEATVSCSGEISQYCLAQQGPRDGGGGALARTTISW
ncbi:MAG: hypothetical protein PVH88_02705 [Ignavibacteria bacterium]|jgi:hypothetical protein